MGYDPIDMMGARFLKPRSRYMRKVIKIILNLSVLLLGLAVVLFVAGFIRGFLTAWKLNKEMIASRTFFGLTLDKEFYPGHGSGIDGINYSEKSWHVLNRDFNLVNIAGEFSLVSSPVKLSKPFFGIELASALLSSHSKRILGIAICKGFDETFENRVIEDFGEAEVLCDKIRKVLEEKHSCQMIPFDQEPSFVKKFIREPYTSEDVFIERIEANIKSRSGVYVSPKSCFVVTPDFFASIFVIGYREIITFPLINSEHYRNKDYVIMLIHSPSLDIERERELRELDYKIQEEERTRKEEAIRIREYQEALEAM